MKAAVVTRFGTPPEMSIVEQPVPDPQPGFTLVRMRAATINQLSNTVRTTGFGGASAPFVLGNEGAGVVEQSSSFPPGSHVAIYGAGQLGVTEDGLQREWALVEDKRVVALPDDFSLDEGAALTVNFITAYQALNRIAHLRPGQTVLVSGATGALGHALMQMTTALGAHPIALVSTTEKAQRAVAAGARCVVDLSCSDLEVAVRDWTGGQGADLAVDSVGGPLTNRLLCGVRPRGTVVAIGFAGGTEASFDLVNLIVHEKRLLGYDLHLEDDAAVALTLAQLKPLVAGGQLRPMIDSTVPLDDIERGYARLASRKAMGAIVLRL